MADHISNPGGNTLATVLDNQTKQQLYGIIHICTKLQQEQLTKGVGGFIIVHAVAVPQFLERMVDDIPLAISSRRF
jgi:hypothetical protein